jgi:hypothetical protein
MQGKGDIWDYAGPRGEPDYAGLRDRWDFTGPIEITLNLGAGSESGIWTKKKLFYFSIHF